MIGDRPAGSSVSVETSRSPKTVIATVRGIGVAVMTSTCGGTFALARKASRCSTPNRCCSSTTTSPRSWKSTVSWISACVPTTMPASPLTIVEQRGAPGGGRLRPGEQGDPGADVGAAEQPALGERPEHRGDRAVVLLREHLGRREQRGLAAGVDDGEHRPQRHDGLAGADLALEQPVHRVLAGQVGRDRRATSSLPVGERERQPRVERREQPVGARPPAAVAGSAMTSARRWARTVCSTNASSKRSRRRAARTSSRVSGRCDQPQRVRRGPCSPRRSRTLGRQRVGAGRVVGERDVERDPRRPCSAARTAAWRSPGRPA